MASATLTLIFLYLRFRALTDPALNKPGLARYIPNLYTGYTRPVHLVYQTRTLGIQDPYTVCTRPVHWVFQTSTLGIPDTYKWYIRLYTRYTRPVHLLY